MGAATAARQIPVDLLIGANDSLLGPARDTRDELMSLGFEVRYTELPGVGHCCYLSMHVESIWQWLSARSL